MTNLIVTHEQLQQMTGCHRVADLEKTLRSNGIRYCYGKNGHLFTTINAIDAAMGLNQTEQQPEKIELL